MIIGLLILFAILAFWLIVSWAVYAAVSLILRRAQKKQPAFVAAAVAILLAGSYAYLWNISWKGYKANFHRMVAFEILVAASLILISYLQKARRSSSSSVVLIVTIPLFWQVISSQSLYLRWVYDTSLLYQRAMILTGVTIMLILAFLRFLPPRIAPRDGEGRRRKPLRGKNWGAPIVATGALAACLALPWAWPQPPTIQKVYEGHLEIKMHILDITATKKRVAFLVEHLSYDAFAKGEREGHFYIPNTKRTWGALKSRAVTELLMKHAGSNGIPYLKEHAAHLSGTRQAVLSSMIGNISSQLSLDSLNYLLLICQGAPEKDVKRHAGKLNITEEHAFTKSGVKKAFNLLTEEDYNLLSKEVNGYGTVLKLVSGDEGKKQKDLGLLQFIRQECINAEITPRS